MRSPEGGGDVIVEKQVNKTVLVRRHSGGQKNYQRAGASLTGFSWTPRRLTGGLPAGKENRSSPEELLTEK